MTFFLSMCVPTRRFVLVVCFSYAGIHLCWFVACGLSSSLWRLILSFWAPRIRVEAHIEVSWPPVKSRTLPLTWGLSPALAVSALRLCWQSSPQPTLIAAKLQRPLIIADLCSGGVVSPAPYALNQKLHDDTIFCDVYSSGFEVKHKYDHTFVVNLNRPHTKGLRLNQTEITASTCRLSNKSSIIINPVSVSVTEHCLPTLVKALHRIGA